MDFKKEPERYIITITRKKNTYELGELTNEEGEWEYGADTENWLLSTSDLREIANKLEELNKKR